MNDPVKHCTTDDRRRTVSVRASMKQYQRLSSFVFRISSLALILLLAACQIEGGVPPATPPGAPASAQPTAVAAATSSISGPTQTAEDSTDTLTIGLLEAERPRDLFPYPTDSSDARTSATVTNLLFPPPLLTYSYDYTTTGVLQQVPSLENGGVRIEKVDRYLDAARNITTTVTDVVTQVDQLVVTFRWNPALRWADGTPVTAQDSLFAYELALKQPLGDDAASKLALTDTYTVVNEYTTEAFLKPDFLDPNYLLTFWTPLPQHLLKDVAPDKIIDSDWVKKPVGYGPYTFDRRDGNTLRLKRNPYYTGATPPAERVLFTFQPNVDALRSGVLNGTIDLASADRIPTDQYPFLQQHQQQGVMQVDYVPSPVWEHLDFNLDVPLLQDYRVRRAFAYGINRQQLVKDLFAGNSTPLDSWLVPGQWAAAPADQITRYPYDPEKAKALLDEAGLGDTNGDGIREFAGEPITVTLITTVNTPVRQAAAERIKEDMKGLGIIVEVQELPLTEMYSSGGPLFQRQFELALFGWIASPDPAGFVLWSCKAVPSESNSWTGNNFSGWCFRDADRAISVATTSLKRDERLAAYLKQQQLFTQEVPVLPLFQRQSVVLASPRLHGIQPDSLAPVTWNMTDWKRSS